VAPGRADPPRPGGLTMTSPTRARRAACAVAALLLVAVGCTDDGDDADAAPDDATTERPVVDEAEETVAAEFTVAPGVEIATVTGAEAGHELTIVDADGEKLLGLVTDEEGQAHFAYVPDEF